MEDKPKEKIMINCVQSPKTDTVWMNFETKILGEIVSLFSGAHLRGKRNYSMIELLHFPLRIFPFLNLLRRFQKVLRKINADHKISSLDLQSQLDRVLGWKFCHHLSFSFSQSSRVVEFELNGKCLL